MGANTLWKKPAEWRLSEGIVVQRGSYEVSELLFMKKCEGDDLGADWREDVSRQKPAQLWERFMVGYVAV